MRKLFAIFSLLVISFLFTLPVLGAVDEDVTSVSALVADTYKENIVGALGDNIGTIVSIAVLVFIIFFLVRMVKRVAGGR